MNLITRDQPWSFWYDYRFACEGKKYPKISMKMAGLFSKSIDPAHARLYRSTRNVCLVDMNIFLMETFFDQIFQQTRLDKVMINFEGPNAHRTEVNTKHKPY